MSDRPVVVARFALLAALTFAASAATAQLSVVNLKDGKTQQGFVVENGERTLKLETVDGKTVTIDKNNVSTIEETKKWGDAAVDAEFEKADANDAESVAKVAAF